MIKLKNYELSVSKGFDTIIDMLAYLEIIKQRILEESEKDGVNDLILTDKLSGDGYEVEVDYNDEKIQ